MQVAPLHPEDIKAELRKRHGTIGKFARTRDLKPQALADWLRGRTSAPVAAAVASELGLSEVHVIVSQSIKMDDSPTRTEMHCLNAEAR